MLDLVLPCMADDPKKEHKLLFIIFTNTSLPTGLHTGLHDMTKKMLVNK